MNFLLGSWQGWCLFWGVVDAAVVVVLLAVVAWSSLTCGSSRWNFNDKRTLFRACPTCRHIRVSSRKSPCRECLEGDSKWAAP